jgi:uncharacterized protein YjiS (DUF1127 family)
MAALDTTRTTYGSLGLIGRIGRIGALFTAATNSVVVWNDARATRNALSDLTDRELEDIGLSRSDIDAVAITSRGF